MNIIEAIKVMKRGSKVKNEYINKIVKDKYFYYNFTDEKYMDSEDNNCERFLLDIMVTDKSIYKDNWYIVS